MRVAFVLPALAGHINPALVFAKTLSENGFEVGFFCEDYFGARIRGNGFQHVHIYSPPFAMGLEELFFSYKMNGGWIGLLLEKLTRQFYFWRSYELQSALEEFNPSHVFIDAFNLSDALVVSKMGLANTVLHTSLPHVRSGTRPPIYYDQHPTGRRVGSAWRKLRFAQMINQLREEIVSLGNTNKRFLEGLARTGSVAETVEFHSFRDFSIAGKHVVLAPKEFDLFGTELTSEFSFTGLLPYEKISRYSGSSTFDFRTLRRRFDKIVFCSLGTIPEAHNSEVQRILCRLVDIFSRKAKFAFVVSGIKDSQKPRFSRSNVFPFEDVDQLEVLAVSDAFISHGGLNSVLESISLKVPIAVIPLNDRSDQSGNGFRVAALKVGRYFPINSIWGIGFEKDLLAFIADCETERTTLIGLSWTTLKDRIDSILEEL